MAVAVSLLQSMDCFGQAVISFAIQHPTPGTFATNQLFVQVSVASTYEVQSVSATVEGQTTPLVFSSTVPGWTNTLSLLGLSHGQKTLTITASDVFSYSAQTQTVFLIDFPPTLTITEPRVGTVARPQFKLDVSATNDDPAGTLITVYAGTNLLASGSNSVNTIATLPGTEGSSVDLTFKAVDSAGQTVVLGRTAYLFTNANWLEVARADGPILDVNTNALLFVDGNALKTKSRSTGTETVLVDDPTLTPSTGWLIADVAIFTTAGYGGRRYEVRDGVVSDLGEGGFGAVEGNFALLIQEAYPYGPLVRRDMAAGTNVFIYSPADSTAALAPNGDVVFAGELVKYLPDHLYLFHDGTTTLLDNGFYTYAYYSFGSDGTNIAYEKSAYSRYEYDGYATLYDGATTSVLATNVSRDPIAINQGWIAYMGLSPSGVDQVWTRSPSGTKAQQTFFGVSSTLLALAPNGEVLFLAHDSDFIGTFSFYLARPGAPPLFLGSSHPGRQFWLSGHWYTLLGRSLFVLSRPPTLSAPTILANGQVNLIVNGFPGDTAIIEASPNLIDWSPIATNSLAGGAVEVVDPRPATGEGSRFYRAFVPTY